MVMRMLDGESEEQALRRERGELIEAINRCKGYHVTQDLIRELRAIESQLTVYTKPSL